MQADDSSGAYEIHMAWWFEWYAWGVAIVAAMTFSEPDWQKVDRVALRAMRVRRSSGSARQRQTLG